MVIATWSEEQAVKVETIHGEAGNGQFEVVLKYTAPITIADNIIIGKETLRQVARKRNYNVTFLSQPFSAACNEECAYCEKV